MSAGPGAVPAAAWVAPEVFALQPDYLFATGAADRLNDMQCCQHCRFCW